MTRQTSIDCYNQIKEEGLLSRVRFQTYKAIFFNAPCTRQEAMCNMVIKNPHSHSASRFSELRELGVIYEKGIRVCKITGRKAIEWDLTDRLPNGKINKKNRPNNLSKCIDYIILKMKEDGFMFLTEEDLLSYK